MYHARVTAHRLLLAALGLLAGACHHLPPYPTPRVSYGAAPIELPLVQLPEDQTRLYVLVETGSMGEQLWFFDTGYSHTTCDATALAQEGVPTRKTLATTRGELGKVRLEAATLPDLDLGGHTVHAARCAVRDLPGTSSIPAGPGYIVTGVLGTNVLRRFVVEVDPAAGVVRLHEPGTLPLDEPFRLRREGVFGPRLMAPVSLDGRETWLILDYGAAGTYLDAERLGLPLTREQPGVWRGTGSSNTSPRTLQIHHVESVWLGPVQTSPIDVIHRDRGAFAPGLLGMDVLGELHLLIDYPHREASATAVEPRPLPVVGSPAAE